jgi:hypothetical protein
MIFKKKLQEPSGQETKKIYFAVEHEIEVPANMTDEEIDNHIWRKYVHGAYNYTWSEKPNLFWEE